MNENVMRLIKLIEHWTEHNDEHGKRFSEEADKAEEMGLIDVSKEMRKASKASVNVSEKLLKALELLRENYG